MKRILFFSIFILIAAGLFGCQALKFSSSTRPVEYQPEKEPIVKTTKSISELYEKAKENYTTASDLVEAGKYKEARALLDKTLVLCLSGYDRNQDEQIAGRLEGLFFETCILQVRLGQLQGTFVRATTKEAPLDLEYNPEVERWLSYYLTNGRRSIEKYLARAGKYGPLIEKVLKEKQMPLELQYLPIIESGYSPYAYSHANAAGIWQFIEPTGKRYGLQIDSWVDERRDPFKATAAATQYLNELYQMFGSWSLALAAYNCGEGAVGRAVKRNNTDNFYRLDLPNETCNYVPKFYAAILIARDPELYGFFIQFEDPLEYETFILERPVDLKVVSALSEVSFEELKGLNPELLSQYTHPKSQSYELRIPRRASNEFKKAFEAASDKEKYLSKSQLSKIKSPKRARGKVVYYRVKKGDSLYKIAKKFRTTVKAIKKWNKKARGRIIKPGMKLKIYPGKKR